MTLINRQELVIRPKNKFFDFAFKILLFFSCQTDITQCSSVTHSPQVIVRRHVMYFFSTIINFVPEPSVKEDINLNIDKFETWCLGWKLQNFIIFSSSACSCSLIYFIFIIYYEQKHAENTLKICQLNVIWHCDSYVIETLYGKNVKWEYRWFESWMESNSMQS